jgi:hypothetical protein
VDVVVVSSVDVVVVSSVDVVVVSSVDVVVVSSTHGSVVVVDSVVVVVDSVVLVVVVGTGFRTPSHAAAPTINTPATATTVNRIPVFDTWPASHVRSTTGYGK